MALRSCGAVMTGREGRESLCDRWSGYEILPAPSETGRMECSEFHASHHQNETQCSGFVLERKKEPIDMQLSRAAEAECSWLLLTYFRWNIRSPMGCLSQS